MPNPTPQQVVKKWGRVDLKERASTHKHFMDLAAWWATNNTLSVDS